MGNNESHIFEFDPFGSLTQRHNNQKSRYTVCLKSDTSTDGDDESSEVQCYFDSHQLVFNNKRNHPNEDIIVKYEMKSCDRQRVLEELDRSNINEYTLMNTVDSLAYWQSQRLFG